MMKNNFIMYEKLSKKEKKRINSEKRNTWNFSPVTRKCEDKTKYKRCRAKEDLRRADPFSVCCVRTG